MKYLPQVEQRLKMQVDGCYAKSDSIIPQLGFNISCPVSPFSAFVLALDGQVKIRTPQGFHYLGRLHRIADSTPVYPIRFYQGSDGQVQLGLDLDWPLIEQIETLRNGGELQLQLEVNLLCAEFSENAQIASVMNINAEVTRNRNSWIIISQREWAEVLSRWGISDLRILEVRMPRNSEYRTAFESALTHISDADQKLINGDYDGTLVACRKAFEAVKAQVDAHMKSLGNDEIHAIRQSKLDALRKAIYGLYAVGAHVGTGANRAEAVLGLSMCKEFLAFLSRSETISRNLVAA